MNSAQLKKFLHPITENEPLSNWTTFKIGGPAKYFYKARRSADLLQAVQVAEKLTSRRTNGCSPSVLPYLILGGGSNILISDKGFDGLVIKVENKEFIVESSERRRHSSRQAGSPSAGSANMKVTCGAGLSIAQLLKKTLDAGLVGLEFMARIYGTVGGAVCGNAGAYGQSFGQLVQKAQVYKDGRLQNYTQKQMKYSYRASVIKETGGVIINATLVLSPGDAAASRKEIKRIIAERKEKLPSDPSAGSVFKNIEMDKIKINIARVAKALDVSEQEFKDAARFKLPIGFIMDKLGLRGKQIGGAAVSEKHGNIIINKGNATAEDVIMLISYIKKQVRDKLGIQLQEEIKCIGFN